MLMLPILSTTNYGKVSKSQYYPTIDEKYKGISIEIIIVFNVLLSTVDIVLQPVALRLDMGSF